MINSTQEKNSNSTIKQTFLSLATISFLATCANASITTISDKVSNGSIVISKAKTTTNSTTKIKNSRSITGGGCSGTTCNINSNQTTGVTISGNNGGTLTIENNAGINVNNGNAIKVNNDTTGNITIVNKGSIQGGSGNGIDIGQRSTIDNINNTGTIGVASNGWNGIDLQNNSIVETITNSGFIQGGKEDGIQLKQGSSVETIANSGTISGTKNGISLNGNNGNSASVNIITNTGTISGNENGIKISNSNVNTITNSGTINGGSGSGISVFTNATKANPKTIQNITNSGIISGKDGIKLDIGFRLGGMLTVDNITNTGTIVSTGTNPTSWENTTGGIVVKYNTVAKTIDNQGLILTKSSGVALVGHSNNGDKNIETLKNSGTIKYTGSQTIDRLNEENGQGAGIYVGNLDGIPKIGTIDNSGLINTYNGMYFALGSQAGTIKNSGTILASKDGIVLGNDEASKEERQTRVDYINNTGTIQAGRYGIFIDVAANDKVPFQIGKINIDGVVSGGVAGFYIGANQKLTEDIIVKGTLTGGSAGIINNGVIGESGSSKGGIKLQDGGLILASNTMYGADAINPAILNTGNGIIYGNTELDSKSKIIGGVVNAGNAKLIGDIIVKGGSSISGGIINTDSGVVTGSIKVQGSDSAIEGGIINDGDGKLQGSIEVSGGGKLDSIVNQGNGQITGDVSVGSGSSVDNITNSG
ncbi:hypothetical protein A0Y59_08275, partial [Campylobacter lari]|nr:hypothetical protein [Campylobacter lari]